MRWHDGGFKYLKNYRRRVIFFSVSPKSVEGPTDKYYKRLVSTQYREHFLTFPSPLSINEIGHFARFPPLRS